MLYVDCCPMSRVYSQANIITSERNAPLSLGLATYYTVADCSGRSKVRDAKTHAEE
jgi:hypothetical protein